MIKLLLLFFIFMTSCTATSCGIKTPLIIDDKSVDEVLGNTKTNNADQK